MPKTAMVQTFRKRFRQLRSKQQHRRKGMNILKKAAEFIIDKDKASIASLQRVFKIGF